MGGGYNYQDPNEAALKQMFGSGGGGRGGQRSGGQDVTAEHYFEVGADGGTVIKFKDIKLPPNRVERDLGLRRAR